MLTGRLVFGVPFFLHSSNTTLLWKGRVDLLFLEGKSHSYIYWNSHEKGGEAIGALGMGVLVVRLFLIRAPRGLHGRLNG
jgi:hypothetical protein